MQFPFRRTANNTAGATVAGLVAFNGVGGYPFATLRLDLIH